MSPGSWPKIVVAGLLIVALGYVAIAGIVYFKQRSFIYFPDRASGIPAREAQIVKFPTKDGLMLAAGYRHAQLGKPVLLAFHGNAANWQSMVDGLQPLTDRGYGVLAVEYRGYQGNPGKPSEDGLYEDGRAALRWLGSKGVPLHQVVAVGNSLGSGVAVQLDSETPLRAVIIVSPVSSMTRLASTRMPWLPVNILLRDRYDNLAKLPRIKAPILLLHGDADRVIPVTEARLLASQNPAVKYVQFPGVGHELMYNPMIAKPILDFLVGA